MANRTTLELSKSVLLTLSVLGSDETPSAADHAYVSSVYRSLYDGLVLEELAYWPEAAIPDLVMLPLTDLVALYSARAFGKPFLVGEKLEAEEASIKRRIRKHTRKPASGAAIFQSDY